jgi:hypothetical protein
LLSSQLSSHKRVMLLKVYMSVAACTFECGQLTNPYIP